MANHVDQAVNGLKKADEHISCGITMLPEFATELIDLQTSSTAKGLDECKAIMREYVQMEQEAAIYLNCVDQVKNLISTSKLKADDVGRVINELYEKEKTGVSVSKSKEYKKFELAIASSRGEASDKHREVGGDEDVEFAEETQSFKCPYTGKVMVDPVKNINCGHSYDKEGISLYIKQRGKRAKCPVSSCKNQAYITQRSLVPNHHLRREIEKHQSGSD